MAKDANPKYDGYPIGNKDPDSRGRGGHPPIGRLPKDERAAGAGKDKRDR